MHASAKMRAGSRTLWKKAEPNHQRIVDDWFCKFQLWHTHQLGCICRSNSCKQWKEKVKKRTLARVQHPRETAWIACHLPKLQPPVGSRTTKRRVTTDHQHHTSANPSKVDSEELSHMLFQDRQTMQRDLCHTPKISRRFASEWRLGPWCCDPDENCTDHYPVLIPLFHGIWHILYLANWRVIASGQHIACDLLSWISE